MSDDKDIAGHEEVLEILTEQARNGSVTAAAALERALRAKAKAEPDQLLADLLPLPNSDDAA